MPETAPSRQLLLEQVKAVRAEGETRPAVSPSRQPPQPAHPPSSLLQLGEGMEVDASPAAAAAEAEAQPAEPQAGRGAPESEALALLVVTLLLADAKQWHAAQAVASACVEKCGTARLRSLDGLGAQAAFLLALSAERVGGAVADAVRAQLLALHRTAVLRQDEAGQAVLVNALLRAHLVARQYGAAEQLRSRLAWPEKHSTSQLVRYLFYTGRIRCVQLEYSEAKESLLTALRKAPSQGALGFRVQLTLWLSLTQLLLGEVPERRLLLGGDQSAQLEAPLRPYFQLAAAVREGDLASFTRLAGAHEARFAADGVSCLVVRLRRTVIRAGLRRLAAAYSRISLADVAARLGLEGGAEDAASVVSKAVRDGAVEARLLPGPDGGLAGGVMLSMPPGEAYSSGEPAAAFHARINFCLNLHNEAVQAMRFPPDAHKKATGETPEQRKERLAGEAELAEALAEEDGDGMGDF